MTFHRSRRRAFCAVEFFSRQDPAQPEWDPWNTFNSSGYAPSEQSQAQRRKSSREREDDWTTVGYEDALMRAGACPGAGAGLVARLVLLLVASALAVHSTARL